MNKIDIFKIWAPIDKLWTNWVRPVPFINLDKTQHKNIFYDYQLPTIKYDKYLDKNTAIILDLDGISSIKEGLVLTNYGYRPIPVFNGTNPNPLTKSSTNNDSIEPFLIFGAEYLKNINIDDNALPAFLLDNVRLSRYKIDKSVFDNSWDIYPQDLPSYKYMLEHNINKILIRSNKLNKDLEKVLYKYYTNNIKLYLCNGYEEPTELKIKKMKIEL